MSAARIWLLTGHRHGDAAQLRALAADLGLPAREIALSHTWARELPNALLGASLASLRDRPAVLAPPWPDAVLAIGRRSVPVARWIATQSGGRTRLVHLGRPRAPLSLFDLVLSTPQYALPDAPNLLRLSLPWQVPLALPPATGPGRHVLALLGGPSWSARPTAATVDALAAHATARARALGLPLVATTAPRTPQRLAARLAARLPEGARLSLWSETRGRGGTYGQDLAQAAEIVLTGDSVSALADAAWTDRPAHVIPVPAPALLRLAAPLGAWRRGGNRALLAPPPDLDGLRDALVARGMAEPGADGTWRLDPCRALLEAERAEALARLRRLIGEAAPEPAHAPSSSGERS